MSMTGLEVFDTTVHKTNSWLKEVMQEIHREDRRKARAQVHRQSDLPERFRLRAPLNPDDPTTYYGGGAKGYTDYPTLAQERGEQPWPCVDERWR